MYIEKRKKGRIPEGWMNRAENALKQFVDEVNYCMDNELFEEEGSQGDCETSYLSQLIFRNLFNMFGYESSYCFDRYILVNNEHYYFDIMNNPNYENPRNNKQNRIGKKISEKNKEKYIEWKNKYHTLGNFAPYPNIKIDNLDIQKFHESKCYERWDLTLAKLQDKWRENSGNRMNFAEYLIATGQIVYDKDVFDLIPSEDITFEWYLQRANEILKKEIKIINFNRDTDDKVLKDENVEYATESILKLIEVRTEILIMLLKKQKSGLKLKIEDKKVLIEE